MHFKPIRVYDLKTKSGFDKKFTLQIRLHNKFEPYIFHYFIGMKLAHSEYSLDQL